ncbi:hypothetical protein [Variovorax sp. UMC13]|uniref:hypothetical protein n=1 Tax=Variovorax sp. UMC13 TaxID=1862326 RepID=UPI001603DCF0|nr:hypothetical protein [Variovorax sp. UMC13]
MSHVTVELLLIVGGSAVAQVAAVWGVLRHEVRGIRAEVARAHGRIDVLENRQK